MASARLVEREPTNGPSRVLEETVERLAAAAIAWNGLSSKTRVYAGLSTDVVRDVSFQNGGKDLLASWLGQRYGRRSHERDEIMEEGKPERRDVDFSMLGAAASILCARPTKRSPPSGLRMIVPTNLIRAWWVTGEVFRVSTGGGGEVSCKERMALWPYADSELSHRKSGKCPARR